MIRRTLTTVGVSIISVLSEQAFAQCQPQFSPQFHAPGTNYEAFATAVFDAGGGPELYIAGSFRTVGDIRAKNIARWNGRGWRPLGLGLDPNRGELDFPLVTSIAVFDADDDGPIQPKLYVGGRFYYAGENWSEGFAAWNGFEWEYLETTGSTYYGRVDALLVHDLDGSGPDPARLVVAGDLRAYAPDGSLIQRIAAWDGRQWSAIGEPFNGYVFTVGQWDADGDGPESGRLIAGGVFSRCGDMPMRSLAIWNGAAWESLGGGVGLSTEPDGLGGVSAIAAYASPSELPTPEKLYIGGSFDSAGELEIRNLARWDGTEWSSVGGEPNESPRRLIATTVDDQPVLLATGPTSIGEVAVHRVGRWNGETWVPFDPNAEVSMYGLSHFDEDPSDSVPPAVFIAGTVRTNYGTRARGVARWNSPGWSPVAADRGCPIPVDSFVLHDEDGAGPLSPALIAGGWDYTSLGTFPELYTWTGESWQAIEPRLADVCERDAGGFPSTISLASFTDEVGPALYVGGSFRPTGSLPIRGIARLSHGRWRDVDYGVNRHVAALQVHDDGSGPALYVGGSFDRLGDDDPNIPAPGVARWNGREWSAVGHGLTGDWSTVLSLGTWDPDGDGPTGRQLIASGLFLWSGDVNTRRIARWDGTRWNRLGGGLAHPAKFIVGFDEGQGERLFVGLNPLSDPNHPPGELRRWDGASWSGVGGGLIGTMGAAAVFDPDGEGPESEALYVSGEFGQAGNIDRAYFVRWDGSAWTALNERSPTVPYYWSPLGRTMIAVDGEFGYELLIGGQFNEFGGTPCENVATFRQAGPAGDLNGDLIVDFNDLVKLLANFGTTSGATDATGDLDGDADVDLSDMAAFWPSFGDRCQ